MRIIYVGAFRFPKYDAAAARVLNNARALRACGHDVKIISWGGQFEHSGKKTGEYDQYDGFRFTISGELDKNDGIIAKVWNRLNRGGKTLDLLKKMGQCPDLVIAYNPDLIFNVKLKRFTSRHGIKYANDITEWSDNNELRFIERITNTINLKYFTHRIKNRIVISSFLNKYYPSGNNLVVPPLCDLSEKKWSVARHEETGHRIVSFIYAGNPAKKDCLHIVINSMQKAIKSGHDYKLLILGVTKEQYLQNYSELLNSNQLHDRIVFMGRVSQDEVPSYYSQSDFMVLIREPNRKSMAGFPTKFVESFVAGIPVVANLTSDLKMFLIDGQTGFVVQDDTEDALNVVLDKIAKIDNDEVSMLKKNVLEKSKLFDYHHHIDAFNEFITKLQ